MTLSLTSVKLTLTAMLELDSPESVVLMRMVKLSNANIAIPLLVQAICVNQV